MKTRWLLYCCNIILVGLILFNIFSYKENTQSINTNLLDINNKRYISYLLLNKPLNNLSSDDEDNTILEDDKKDAPQEKNEPIEKDETPKNNDMDSKVIETLTGSLVGYGPDCYGCTSNRTASGMYIGEGNIYYNDSTYGKVRIVAGDISYPFGTIVRISNVDLYNDEPFYAVVLDRGGDIGKNNKFLFDLLFTSESDAYSLGIEYNIKFEIMRLGY